MTRRSLAFTALAFLVFVLNQPTLSAQTAPICDTTCSPNPTDPSYGGLLASRVMKQNARGAHNAVVAMVSGPLKVPRLPGSQSYNKGIPILALPGRGIDLNLMLWYNSRIYNVDTTNSTVTFNADRDFPSYGFRLGFGFIEYDSTNAQMILTERDGSKHSLPLAANVTGGSIYDSNDGSFIEFSTVNLKLSYRNGAIIQYQPFPNQPVQGQTTLYRPVKLMDTNRNYISISYVPGTGNDQHVDTITDTLGRIIKFVYVNGLLSQIQQLNGFPSTPGFDSSGTRVWATFTWAQTTLNYNFSSSLRMVSTPSNGSTINVLTACKYPNGTGYQFSYSPWGIVNRIDLLSSSGTTRSYESYSFPDTSQPLSDVPTYTSMKVSPDGSSFSTWNYVSTQNGLGQITKEISTDPLGKITTVNLNTDGSIFSTETKDGTGKIFQTVSFTWTNSLISSVASKDDAGNQSSIAYAYDSHGNVTDIKQFDFTGTTPIREIIASYMQAPYTTNHIFNLPQSIQTKDGSGNVKGRLDFGYDESAPTVLTPFPLQNDGNNTAPRGNLTSATRYPTLSDLTKTITRTLAYDAAGNMIVEQMDCCSQKKLTFTPSSQYAYLSSTTRGPDGGQQFTTGFNFNLDNGLLQSSTDENNQRTSLQYDNMYRVIKVTPPAPAGVQTINYADDILTPQIKTTTTGNTSEAIRFFDGLGHMTQQQLVDTSTGNPISTTQFQYDAIWRRQASSNPYAPGEAVVWNNVGYDVLNRAISMTPPSAGGSSANFAGNTVLITDPAGKQRKNFYDALGRLVRVDEPGWGDALAAIDSISISGSERSKIVSTRYCAQYTFGNPPRCVDWEFDTSTDYDNGNVTASINGVLYTYPYGQNDTASTVATNLAGKINSDPARVVNASTSGSTVNLYAVNPGASGNSISVSTSSLTSNSTEFGSGTTSFPASTFTPDLSGGENAVTQDNAVLSATRHITTTYAYDVFDHLVLVSQGAMTKVNGGNLSGQPRSYAYDDLGRLTSATTPESGTVTNYYTDPSGNACSGDPSLVCRTVDARGIIKTFSYNDPLSRLTGVSYNDSTPPAVYAYDTGGQAAFALGRLTKITEDLPSATTPNAQTFSYDNLGRVTVVTESIAGTDYPVKYGYNSAGQMISLTYPSGRIVNPGYDAVGRLAHIADSVNPTPYVSVNSADYNGAGEIKKVVLGNGITGLFGYDDHLQLSTIRYYNPTAPTGTADVLNLSYDYTSTAQPSNNGKIQVAHYYTVPGTEDKTRSESFAYDAWNRLRQAQTLDTAAANTWNLNWGYDRLGNRFSQSGTVGTATIGQPTFSINPATNRIIGYCYDLAGNLTDEAACPTGAHQYTYDGANRLTQINGGTATYSYFGQLRIKKTAGNGTTLYIYSGGKPIAEYAAGAALTKPSKEYIYAGSQLLASVAGGGTTYYHADHLSNRAETDSTGNVLRRMGNFPYGESWYDSASVEKWKFTSYERDLDTGETGLDYAQFRYYSSGAARFISADFLAGNISNPSSLNRYSYVTNDPVNLTDPLGLAGGNWRCRLLDHGDCAGGDYVGLNSTAGLGLWEDPFGNWVDPTKWDPLGQAEDEYDKMVKLNQLMNQYHVEQVYVNVDANGVMHVWIPGAVQSNPNYDPNKPIGDSNAQFVMVSLWVTLRLGCSGCSGGQPSASDKGAGWAGASDPGPVTPMGGGGGGGFVEDSKPDPCISTHADSNQRLKEASDEWHVGSGINAVGTLLIRSKVGAEAGIPMTVVGSAFIVDAWTDELAVKASSWVNGCGWSW
jgi:RHS repeat-associated protein